MAKKRTTAAEYDEVLATGVGEEIKKVDVLADPLVQNDYETYYALLMQEASPVENASLVMLADRLAYYYAVTKHAERAGWSPIGDGPNAIEHPVGHYRMIADTFKNLMQSWNIALERSQKPSVWKRDYEEKISFIIGDVLSEQPESMRAIIARIDELEAGN